MQRILDDIREAIESGRGVVALESTLIAHGLPFPDNLETARSCEAAVRASESIPATIAIHDGCIQIGLTERELIELAMSQQCRKASRRDIASALHFGGWAATTVSATLSIARRFGVLVMATGGLGGVHRGAEHTFDISTDLDELGRANGMVVVCSGVKSILNIPATLEVLETRGVTILGYRTDEFPAFTTVSSGIPLEFRVETPEEVAAIVRRHRALGLPGAIVVANPVPESLALDRDLMEQALARALHKADQMGVTGKYLTPFLLDTLREETAGKSLAANRALIVSNAYLAGDIAACLASENRADS